MTRILAIANQKGGVGKTTTAVNLAASLAVADQRVLLVDLDPQGNATSAYGIDKAALPCHAYHVLVDGRPLGDALVPTALEGLSLLPTNTDLVGAEIELVTAIGRETRLRDALAEARGDYDIVLIDCPPSLGLLTLNALTAADGVLIPLQCEYYAMEGMSHLLRTLDLVKAHLNPTLALQGIVLTMYDRRNRLTYQVEREVVNHFGPLVLPTRSSCRLPTPRRGTRRRRSCARRSSASATRTRPSGSRPCYVPWHHQREGLGKYSILQNRR